MAVTRAVEVERKYEVPDRAVLPSLAALPGVVSAEALPVAQLDAVYVDTDDRTLLRARIAVRRRTGGHDAGWHVKLPAAGGRIELHEPIGPDEPDAVPPGLARALFSRVRGRDLAPIARIRTERRGVVVTDVDGGRVEVVDDRVTATDLRAGAERSWREWEAEQVGDPEASAALLTRVDAALVAVGARPSPSPAKLAQALGGPFPESPPDPGTTAGARLTAVVEPLVERLHAQVSGLVQEGDADGEAVHALRRTIRRLRSLLTLEAVAGPAAAEARDRLRRLGGPLGEARDPVVAATVAADLLRRVPDDVPGVDAARRRLVDDPRRGLADATEEVVRLLLAPDAADAYAALDRFVADGPQGPAAGAGPRRLVALAEHDLRRAVRRGRRTGSDLDALHEARKAARRARFVIEGLVAAGIVPPAGRLARGGEAAEAVQDALGAHRDVALLRARLREVSAAATAAGEDAFALGVLDGAAAAEEHRLLRRARRRAKALARRR